MSSLARTLSKIATLAMFVASLTACTPVPAPAPSASIPRSPSGVWIDQADGITFLRDAATSSDAALCRGRFTVGADGCLYLVVSEDSGPHSYIAAVSPDATVSRASVSQGGISYGIGELAFFTRAHLRGEVPTNVHVLCGSASEVWSALLVKASDPRK